MTYETHQQDTGLVLNGLNRLRKRKNHECNRKIKHNGGW